MNLRFLDSAEEEMLEAAQVYEDQAVGLGERFLDEVEGMCGSGVPGELAEGRGCKSPETKE